MRVPESLTTLFDYGVLDDVVRPLMSGKEAQVYLVVSGGKYAVAKIYKEAQNRSFKHRAEYTEGRKVRNTRDQRAMGKRSKHGREQDEAAWRSTEVDMIHRLHAAGVRVPVPYHFVDGVLVMELITDAEGNPAPRLGDIAFEPAAALAMYERLMREVVKMLCAGVVHGDLSEFNVLVSGDGPVIIDFPQSIDSAHNTNAKKLLLRDVDNLQRFLSRIVPSARRAPYAQEMWNLYEQNLLTPDTKLRGDFRTAERRVNTAAVLDLIDDANRDERKRREALGLRGGPPPSNRPDTNRGPAAPYRGGRPDANRGPAAPYRGGGGGGGGGRGPGHGGGHAGPPRGGGRPTSPSGPKKDAPVYQGLANEGLSSAWGQKFREKDDPRNRAPFKLTPRQSAADDSRRTPTQGGSSQQPAQPPERSPHPTGERRQEHPRREGGSGGNADRNRGPRGDQGRPPHAGGAQHGDRNRTADRRPDTRPPHQDRARSSVRPEVERIHARPNLGARDDTRPPPRTQDRVEPTKHAEPRERDTSRDVRPRESETPVRRAEPHENAHRGSKDSPGDTRDSGHRRRVRRSGATSERSSSDSGPKDR